MKFMKKLGVLVIVGSLGYGTYYLGANQVLDEYGLDTTKVESKVEGWISAADNFIVTTLKTSHSETAAVIESDTTIETENVALIEEEVDYLAVPEVSLSLEAISYSQAKANVSIVDMDSTISSVVLSAALGGFEVESETIDLSNLDGIEFTFSNLYSSEEYEITVQYEYLATEGSKTTEITSSITLEAPIAPEFHLIETTNYSDGFLLSTTLEDLDFTLEEGTSLELRQNEVVLETVDWTVEPTVFGGLSAGEIYDVYLIYSYNLNQLESVKKEELLTTVTINFTAPTVTLGTPIISGVDVTIPYTIDDPFGTISQLSINLFLSPMTYRGEYQIDLAKSELKLTGLDETATYDIYLSGEYNLNTTESEVISLEKVSITTGTATTN